MAVEVGQWGWATAQASSLRKNAALITVRTFTTSFVSSYFSLEHLCCHVLNESTVEQMYLIVEWREPIVHVGRDTAVFQEREAASCSAAVVASERQRRAPLHLLCYCNPDARRCV